MPISGPAPDTIVAISTPPGRGGIGIVRLSGPDALTIAALLVRLPETPVHAHAHFTRVFDPQNPDRQNPDSKLDDALVTVFRAPHSYTADDVVEIAAHGSPIILQAILQAALDHAARLALPVRLAQPGEFTQRAFLSGRLDLTQAEAVHDLIAAQTVDAARVAAQQLGGALSRQVAPAKGSLLHLIALLEAGMDFASGELDDVDVVPPAQIAAAIADAHAPLAALAATFRRGQLLREGAALALVGPPNAGKSSLFNRLLDRDRAIVTPVPGTTRDTLEEAFSLHGIPLRLIDTAGLRETTADLSSRPEAAQTGALVGRSLPERGGWAAEVERPPHLSLSHPQHVSPDLPETLGIARTHEALADADLILLIHDATQPVSPDEQALAASLTDRPHLVIHNKVDLLPPTEASPLESRTSNLESPPILTSALTGAGLEPLREAILNRLGVTGALAETALLSNLRQQQAVLTAIAALDAAATANAASLPHELLLLDLHAALTALDSLTGITTPDDILARIFSTFCIGK
jgi:tRNA modification GTPase